MGFGNFRIYIFCFYLGVATYALHGQQQTTSDFLYHQLDYFLQNPSSSSLLRLDKLTISKKEERISKADYLAWVIVHCNLGFYQNKYGNKSTAIQYYEEAWKTYNQQQLSDYDIIENCLQPLGNLYTQIGDLTKAEHSITSYLFLAEQSKNKNKVVSAITNLSITYNNLGNYNKAIKILQKGLEIDSNNTNLLNNLATNHLDTQNYDQAEIISNRILSVDPKQVNAHQILAAVYLSKKDFEKARSTMHQAKSILVKNPNASARDIAKLQLAFIDILVSQSAFTEAIIEIKEIYQSLLPDYKTTSGLPTEDILIADKILLKTLDLNAYIFEELEQPDQVIKAYELAFEVNAKLNEIYPLQNTKIIQHSQHRNRVEKYIELSYQQFQTHKKTEIIDKAFQAAAKSKAPIVSEALFSKSILAAYTNDSLVLQKEQVSMNLAQLETKILKEKLKGDQANINAIQQWSTNYNNYSISLRDITGQLKKKYPLVTKSYQSVSISDIQKKLKDDKLDMLIEYFYGNQFVYQFEIQKDQLSLKKIGTRKQIDQVIIPYILYFDTPSKIINDIPAYSSSAYNAYKRLKLPSKTKSLLIIPDGPLNFVPFEALLTAQTNTLRFENMPFLLKTNRINYEISSRKYANTIHGKHQRKQSVLGLFPIFENSDLALPFSNEEHRYLQQHTQGEFLIKENATYQNFTKKAQKHSIIHLSTHAESGNFTKPASIKLIDQDILVTQLYGLNITADLIVLSACETGVGKLTKGEGPLSIGRGFQYAGANNVLFSLWKVNDKSTSLLMKDFYQNLDQSNTQALHQAKLNYLNNSKIANAQKSPYHWAAFVYYGEIQAPTSYNMIWKYLIVVVCIVFILLLPKLLHKNT